MPFLDGGAVLTSSELIARLAASGISTENARQRLRRSLNTGGVWRSESLRLARDERLFADRTTLGTPDFFAAVAERLRQTSRRGISRCLEALSLREVLHKVDLMKLLAVSEEGSIRGRTGGGRMYDRELAAIEEIGGKVAHKGTPLESVVSPIYRGSQSADDLANTAASSVRAATMITRLLVERLRKLNLFSWNRVERPCFERPYTTFNGQVFSSFSFCYPSPLTRWDPIASKPVPTPVLIDVYDGSCLSVNIDSFIARIDRATHRGKSVLPILAIVAAKDFPDNAWKTARDHGFMTVNFRQMFGEEALQAMVLAEKCLQDLAGMHAGNHAEERFSEFALLLEELKINPVIVELRSIAFEMLAALIVRSRGYERVEVGLSVPWQQTSRDVDVFGFQGDDLLIIECKAHHQKKSIPDGEATKFFTETVPALKHWLRKQGRQFDRCKAEIWSTGPQGRKARNELFALKRPSSDDWQMLSRSKIEESLPSAIRHRGVKLLRAISMERDGEDDVLYQAGFNGREDEHGDLF